jgi:hypothetical protein
MQPMGSGVAPATRARRHERVLSTQRRRAGRSFNLAMALAVAVIVGFGFGPTANARLLRSPSPRPLLLYVHAAMFTGWVLLFVVQAALVHVRHVAWHRRLGLTGAALGALMPVVGIATALVMTRLNRLGREFGGESFLIVSFFDMLAFGVTFGLAMYWRRRPEYHRRLMLMATCGLTVAAFARFPRWLMPGNAWYVAVDALILIAVAQDWYVDRHIHPVYRYGLPALIVGQATVMWIYVSRASAWVEIAHALLQ